MKTLEKKVSKNTNPVTVARKKKRSILKVACFVFVSSYDESQEINFAYQNTVEFLTENSRTKESIIIETVQDIQNCFIFNLEKIEKNHTNKKAGLLYEYFKTF